MMQASSEEVGTALVLQLAGVNQLPPAVFVHESVHPLALAAVGAQIVRATIASTAIRIVRVRPAAPSTLVSPSMFQPPFVSVAHPDVRARPNTRRCDPGIAPARARPQAT